MPEVSDFTGVLSGRTWADTNGVAVITGRTIFVTYSFDTVAQSYISEGGFNSAFINSFEPFTETEKTQARTALAAWAAVSGIRFLEVSAGLGDMRFAAYNFDFDASVSTAAAFAFYPNSFNNADYSYRGNIGGDVFLNTQVTNSVYLMLHEIGHAIGMKHSFEGDNTLAPAFENHTYTVMSYTGPGPDQLGLFDDDAALYLYGPATEDGTLAKTWTWNPTTFVLTQNGFSSGETFYGVSTRDVISSGSGADIVSGFGGDDLLKGGDGNDSLHGGDGKDVIYGGNQDDIITGGAGDDLLIGDAGNDEIYGDEGYDRVYGRDGDDYIYTGVGVGKVYGEAGNDAVFGDSDRDYFYGGTGDDFMLGGGNADRLYGEDNDDNLYGEDGTDLLDGGAGDDYLVGGDGRDTLTGGAGIDVFEFSWLLNASTNYDVVTDYTIADDWLYLDDAVFAGMTPGALAAGAFRIDTQARDADDRIIYDSASGILYFDADGSGGLSGKIRFAVLPTGLALDANEFYIV